MTNPHTSRQQHNASEPQSSPGPRRGPASPRASLRRLHPLAQHRQNRCSLLLCRRHRSHPPPRPSVSTSAYRSLLSAFPPPSLPLLLFLPPLSPLLPPPPPPKGCGAGESGPVPAIGGRAGEKQRAES